MTENTSIPFEYPGLALIKCIQGQAHPLTMSAIDLLVLQLYRDTRVNAEYLFVSERGARDLGDACRAYRDLGELYLSLYRGLHVVTLPTLPEAVFLIGILDIEQKVMPAGTRLASTTRIPMPDVFLSSLRVTRENLGELSDTNHLEGQGHEMA